MIDENILNRKGARSRDEVPTEVLDLLNEGLIETKNLVEWLAMDQLALANFALEFLRFEDYQLDLERAWPAVAKESAMKKTVFVATKFFEYSNQENRFLEVVDLLRQHPSDVVRQWGAFMVGLNSDLALTDKLALIRPFAADKHMSVREMAWLALRTDVIASLPQALQMLENWAKDSDENIRRFATEATRPRGVWCAHCEELKKNPELGFPLLNILMDDPSRYVQNSVANWLNDASKSAAETVQDFCNKWQEKSDSKNTAYIIKRALRTLRKES